MKGELNLKQFHEFFKGDPVAEATIRIISQDLKDIEELLTSTMKTDDYQVQIIKDLFRGSPHVHINQSKESFSDIAFQNGFKQEHETQQDREKYLGLFKTYLENAFDPKKINHFDRSCELLTAGFHQASFLLLGKTTMNYFFLGQGFNVDNDSTQDHFSIFQGEDNNLYVSHEYKVQKIKSSYQSGELSEKVIKCPFEIKTTFCLNPDKFDIKFSIDTKNLHKKTGIDVQMPDPEKSLFKKILLALLEAIKNLFHRKNKHELSLPEEVKVPEAHALKREERRDDSCH